MAALIKPDKARAYVNHGRWIADCPQRCGCASKLAPKEVYFHCTECGHICEVEWPDKADEIWQVLEKRPAPSNRNWFPEFHELALRANCPHGQTPEELVEETYEHGGV